MNRDHFHPSPRADPVLQISDLRSAQHMNLASTAQKEFPKWDQTSFINIHAPIPLMGRPPRPAHPETQHNLANQIFIRKNHANLPRAVPIKSPHRSQASGGSPHL